MPKKGQRSISIKEKIYDDIEKYADKEHRTVTNMVELILLRFMESEK